MNRFSPNIIDYFRTEKVAKTSVITSVFWSTRIDKLRMILLHTLTTVKVGICWDENKIIHEFKNSRHRSETLFDYYPTILGTEDEIRSTVHCTCWKIFLINSISGNSLKRWNIEYCFKVCLIKVQIVGTSMFISNK